MSMSEHRRTARNEFVQPHWTERADRVGDNLYQCGHPIFGLVAENENGTLLVPAWRNPHHDNYPGGWWNRRLNLRRPTHWLPYLRSRLTRSLVWVETP
jgi:hypothetical protein